MTSMKDKANHSYLKCGCGATTTSLDISNMKPDRTQPGEAVDPDAVVANGKRKGKKK